MSLNHTACATGAANQQMPLNSEKRQKHRIPKNAGMAKRPPFLKENPERLVNLGWLKQQRPVNITNKGNQMRPIES